MANWQVDGGKEQCSSVSENAEVESEAQAQAMQE
jgi:hypothetical protein